MAVTQIKVVSIKHEAIMDFMLANPGVKLGIVAGHFDVTQAWLSIIIHSDAFQAQLSDKQRELFGATLVPLREKVLGLGHVAVEKLGEALENASPVSDKAFIADTANSVLKNLGFSPKSLPVPPAVQNNFITVERGVLGTARKLMQTAGRTLEGELIEAATEGSPGEGV